MDNNFLRAVGWLLLDEMGQEGKALGSIMSSKVDLDGFESVKSWLEVTFWHPMLCGKLPIGLDYYMFDLAYRFEVKLAGRWGKEVFNLYELKTIDPAGVCDIINQLDALSRRSLRSKKLWFDNKHRWTNRSNRVKKRALQLALEGMKGD